MEKAFQFFTQPLYTFRKRTEKKIKKERERKNKIDPWFADELQRGRFQTRYERRTIPRMGFLRIFEFAATRPPSFPVQERR